MAPETENFAVLLNPNARRVSQGVCDRISELVDPEHVYVSDDEELAPELLHAIMEKGYDTVFAGGGDGTVTSLINHLPDGEGSPRVGILKLGTGNAMAEIVSSGDPMVDLRTFTANGSTENYQLDLCEAEGTRFAFAGLGVDASILNDYREVKRRFGRGVLRPVLQNVGGYFAATFTMTIPRIFSRWVKRHKVMVSIVNVGATAHAIEPDEIGGRVGRTYEPGEVLFEGPANTVLFGTCPFYGYRMKMLPYAGLEPGRFHLRVSNVPIGTLLSRLSSLWRGTFRHPKMADFHADRVRIKFSEPVPYQMAGEAMGYRTEITVGMAQDAIDLVRFI